MRLDELLALHEHAAAAAAGVVDATLVRRQHLDQHLDDAGRRVELAALLALGGGELAEEVFVDLAEQVLGAMTLAEADGRDQVDQLAELAGFELAAAEALVEDALQARVVGLDGFQRGVDAHADVGLLGLRADGLPARRGGHPEHVGHRVVVALLQRLGVVGGVGQVQVARLVGERGLELRAALVEGVADVLEEDQAEDDVLVLGGVHRRAQLVGGGPEGLL